MRSLLEAHQLWLQTKGERKGGGAGQTWQNLVLHHPLCRDGWEGLSSLCEKGEIGCSQKQGKKKQQQPRAHQGECGVVATAARHWDSNPDSSCAHWPLFSAVASFLPTPRGNSEERIRAKSQKNYHATVRISLTWMSDSLSLSSSTCSTMSRISS